MTYLLAVFAFPLLVAALSSGFGLLVERIAGWRVPALLLAPLGFAAIIGVTQLTTWADPLAAATPWIVLAVGVAGFVLARGELRARWSARRSGWWWGPAAGVAAYLIANAPVVLAFRATFPAYLLDTTGSVQMMGAERLVTDGHDWFEAGSGYGLQLDGYFGHGYPSGSHSALGALGRLVPVDYLWLYAPYLACAIALSALVLAWVARRVGLAAWQAAIAGCVAAVPALVYSYVLMGAIKEIALLPVLMLLGALVLLAREQFATGPRGVVPLAVVGAAGWGAIGLAFTPWFALAAAAILVLGLPALDGGRSAWLKGTALRAGVALVVLALLALPTVGELKTAVDQATGVSNSNQLAVADPGNLLRPLLDVQLFGVWIGPSHRVDPDEYLRLTYVGIGVVAVATMLGVLWLLRRRQWGALAWVALSLVVWLVLTPRATAWTAAKLIVLFSPVVLLVAMTGAFGRFGRRLEGLLLGGAIAAFVLGSNAFAYHYTGLAPTQRFDELHEIGERFAGERPTLAADFDEYAMYLLRDMAPDAPGFARRVTPWALVAGGGTGYGRTYDLDELVPEQVDAHEAIVLRRSPYKSRPPGDFRRVFRGDYYEVWERDPAAARPLLHRGLTGVDQPATAPGCKVVRRFAADARAAGASELIVAARPANVVVSLLRTGGGSGNIVWNREAVPPSATFTGPGTLTASARVRTPGEYRLWLRGNVGRELRASIDGQPLGGVRNESGGDGNVLRYGTVRLGEGDHHVELVRGGGTLRPGDADATTISGIALEPVPDEASLETVPLAKWRSLCDGEAPFDWLEAR
jgi:hypothetical protein